MSVSGFPRLDEVDIWHRSAINGFDAMEALAAAYPDIPHAIDPELSLQVIEIRGFTQLEWLTWRAERVEHQELFAIIALFASFEGILKWDFRWRASERRALHHQAFFHTLPRNPKVFVPMARVLGCWKTVATGLNDSQLEQVVRRLEKNYQDERNVLAHGRNITVTPFQKLYRNFTKAKAAFQSAVPDFL